MTSRTESCRPGRVHDITITVSIVSGQLSEICGLMATRHD